ncbi:hypothetical protein SK803_04065 [Lentzea sp. BCCO 10_0856]|uniref:Uncharacterized protein n=1 Tax=Lentzea miocenica TaxID=3095431 RepID=A0ABU4SU08_9PSEU|nr:hypothetical protein [Lentzea sp. BCCO 10_0856]MDX8029369.1 hypothetical protein [Lentzea sp. BCCO 10_0856]
MREEDAIRAAQQIGLAPGEHVTMQTEGQINNPHGHHRDDTGPQHVDGWYVENNGGNYSARKIHSDDR